MLKDFQLVGRDLFQAGLNNSHSGNLSVRLGGRVLITRRGAMLGHLTGADLVETGLEVDDENTQRASTELLVHRAVYRGTAALAVVHAHPVHAVALSLLEDRITPLDAEGLHYLKEVPVLAAEQTIGSREVEEKLPELLHNHKIVVVRGHGAFAAGQSLEEAYLWTSSLENACRIIYLTRTLQGAR